MKRYNDLPKLEKVVICDLCGKKFKQFIAVGDNKYGWICDRCDTKITREWKVKPIKKLQEREWNCQI